MFEKMNFAMKMQENKVTQPGGENESDDCEIRTTSNVSSFAVKQE